MTTQSMRIGLEYEGVILKDGNIIRFSSMPVEHQEIIKAKYANPHDNYDCLAECRTLPFTFESTRDVAYKLFEECSKLTSIYNDLGYNIHWGELEIPKEIHDSIKSDVKFKKPMLTINKGFFVDIDNSSEEKFYRGGGIHLNISGKHVNHLLGLILHIYKDNWRITHSDFSSFYRKNFLFRFKPEFNGIELMSIGFDATKFNGLRESFESTKHFFHLFDPIVAELNRNK